MKHQGSVYTLALLLLICFIRCDFRLTVNFRQSFDFLLSFIITYLIFWPFSSEHTQCILSKTFRDWLAHLWASLRTAPIHIFLMVSFSSYVRHPCKGPPPRKHGWLWWRKQEMTSLACGQWRVSVQIDDREKVKSYAVNGIKWTTFANSSYHVTLYRFYSLLLSFLFLFYFSMPRFNSFNLRFILTCSFRPTCSACPATGQTWKREQNPCHRRRSRRRHRLDRPGIALKLLLLQDRVKNAHRNQNGPKEIEILVIGASTHPAIRSSVRTTRF